MTRLKSLVYPAKIIALFTIIFFGLITIIGTGSNSTGTDTVACANSGQNVRTGSAVVLDARCSDFTDGASDSAFLYYSWRLLNKPVGSNAFLGSNEVIASFIADVDGEYQVQLSTGVNASTDASVTRLITATTGNAQPVVEAGATQEVAIGDVVSLSAAGRDADDDSLSYSWSLNPASDSATLTTPNMATAGFTAELSGEYRVDVMANDGAVNSRSDTVLVRAGNTNLSLPVAVAGADQYIGVGSQASLDGFGSYSAYGRPLSYQWRMLSKPNGSNTMLSAGDGSQPSFIADVAGAYVLRLRVNDGINDSNRSIDGVFEDRLVVFAQDNRLPVADAGSDQVVNTGVTVDLDASGSSDSEMATLTYAWSIISQPSGSTATLSSSDTETTQLTPDRDGDYLVRLVVNDGSVDSYPDIVRVSASSMVGGATEMTVVTSMPFTPSMAEIQTWILIDNDGSDEVAVIGSDETQPSSFDIALMVGINGSDAEFSAGPGWSVISPAVLTISDSTTPTFILQRGSDSVYYQLIVDFTVLSGTFNVQIDNPLQAWRCGASAVDCP